jgi:hypothetical protein
MLLDDVKLDFKTGYNINLNLLMKNFKWGLKIGFLGFLVFVTSITTISNEPIVDSSDKKIVGEFLSNYKDFDYKLMVSEAGMLPFYSKWNVIDAWGLNSRYIVQNGLTIDYIDSIKPDVIQFHVFYDNLTEEWENSNDNWNIMTHTLYNYSKEMNYTLACIIESWIQTGYKTDPNGYQWYFINKNMEHYNEILVGLNSFDFKYSFNFQ